MPVLLGDAQFDNIPRPLQNATHFRAEEDGYSGLKRRLQGQAPALRPVPGETTLAVLQARFSGPRAHDVQALCGMGGVGKSQIRFRV